MTFPARLGLLLLLPLLAYFPLAGNDFVLWDDHKFITDNPHIRALSLENLSWMLRPELENWHPLTWLGYAVTHYFFGLDARAYHFFSLLLHSLNTLWFALLVWVLLNLHAQRAPFARHAASVNAAWLSGALFALHPQHVEVVAWASELKELLSVFFYLAALLAYVLYTRRGQVYWYGLSLSACLLALSAKPMAVSLPLALLILDYYPLQRRTPLLRLLWEKAPFFALAFANGLLTLWAQQRMGAMAEGVDLGARLLNAAHSIMMYVWQWLVPLHFSPFYPYRDAILSYHWQTFAPVLLVLGLTLAAARVWRSQPWLTAAWLFYLLTLAPVLGLVQVGGQAAADRYAYLPTLPFYLFAGVGMVRLYALLAGKDFLQRSSVLVLALVFALLALLSARQNLVWRNNLSLWEYTAGHAPRHPLPLSNLGVAYLQMGRYDDSSVLFEMLVNMPNNQDPGDYYNLATAYLGLERYEDARRVYHFMLAQNLSAGDKQSYIYSNLARIYRYQGNHTAARAAAHQALALKADNAAARALLAELAE
jgi:protein O-mannosyl-transferase